MVALKSLKSKVNNGELMVIPTDKSSKVASETRDQYVPSMANQVTNDHVISLEERKDIENTARNVKQLRQMVETGTEGQIQGH